MEENGAETSPPPSLFTASQHPATTPPAVFATKRLKRTTCSSDSSQSRARSSSPRGMVRPASAWTSVLLRRPEKSTLVGARAFAVRLKAKGAKGTGANFEVG